MTNPVDLIDEEIKTTQEQLDIDIKKVSLYPLNIELLFRVLIPPSGIIEII